MANADEYWSDDLEGDEGFITDVSEDGPGQVLVGLQVAGAGGGSRLLSRISRLSCERLGVDPATIIEEPPPPSPALKVMPETLESTSRTVARVQFLPRSV